MKKENSQNGNNIFSKIDKKQLIVGIIILIVAILTLSYAFKTTEDKNINEGPKANVTEATAPETAVATEEAVAEEVVAGEETVADEATAAAAAEKAAAEKAAKPHVSLTFNATAEKEIEYVISFTTEEEMNFNGKNVVTQPIKKGTANYTVDFPVEKILSFRFDMSIDSGKMKVKDFKLIGTQEEDISNPTYYEIMGKIKIEAGKVFVVDDKKLPTLVYHPEFKDPEFYKKLEAAKAATKAEEVKDTIVEVIDAADEAATEAATEAVAEAKEAVAEAKEAVAEAKEAVAEAKEAAVETKEAATEATKAAAEAVETKVEETAPKAEAKK